MHKWRVALIIAVGVCGLCTACGSAPTSAGLQTSAAHPTEPACGSVAYPCPPTSGPRVTPTPGPAVLVRYHRTGSDAGIDETLIVFDDGMLWLTRPVYDPVTQAHGQQVYKQQIDPSSLVSLDTLLQSPAWSQLAPNYGTVPCADCWTYEVEVAATNQRVRTFPPVAQPPVLTEALAQLNRLADMVERA